jgi:hypothetical protein
MLPTHSGQNSSRKNLKWPLFLILMVVSILAYTHTSNTDLIVNKKSASHTKNAKVMHKVTTPPQVLAWLDENAINGHHSPLMTKHEKSNLDSAPTNIITADNKADTEQSFQFSEDEAPTGKSIAPSGKHTAYYDPNNNLARSQYISTGGSAGGSGGSGGGGKGGKSEGNNDPSPNGPAIGDEHGDGDGNVSAVPLPPAIWLLGSALIGLAGLRKRTTLN